jgi:hypothetical protein
LQTVASFAALPRHDAWSLQQMKGPGQLNGCGGLGGGKLGHEGSSPSLGV